MELNKLLEISELLEIYGGLLTDKQRDVMQLYYNEDLSLGEIGQELSISRQAIHDTVKKSEKLLYEYDQKLSVKEQIKEVKDSYKYILYEVIKAKKKMKDNNLELAMETLDQLIDLCEELSE